MRRSNFLGGIAWSSEMSRIQYHHSPRPTGRVPPGPRPQRDLGWVDGCGKAREAKGRPASAAMRDWTSKDVLGKAGCVCSLMHNS